MLLHTCSQRSQTVGLPAARAVIRDRKMSFSVANLQRQILDDPPPPTSVQFFYISMQFSGKFGRITGYTFHPHPLGWRPSRKSWIHYWFYLAMMQNCLRLFMMLYG